MECGTAGRGEQPFGSIAMIAERGAKVNYTLGHARWSRGMRRHDGHHRPDACPANTPGTPGLSHATQLRPRNALPQHRREQIGR
jgi:hypothetical protein